MSNPRSTASIGGHPIHAMLVPFPVGLAIDSRGALLIADDVGNTVWRVTAR